MCSDGRSNGRSSDATTTGDPCHDAPESMTIFEGGPEPSGPGDSLVLRVGMLELSSGSSLQREEGESTSSLGALSAPWAAFVFSFARRFWNQTCACVVEIHTR
jgi:hypothetical protein